MLELVVVQNLLTSQHSLQILSALIGIIIAVAYWFHNEDSHSLYTLMLSLILGFTITYGLTGFAYTLIAPGSFGQHPNSTLITTVGSAMIAFYGFKVSIGLVNDGTIEEIM